jgi:Putative Ig domain
MQTFIKLNAKVASLLILTGALTACGGGGSSSTAPVASTDPMTSQPAPADPTAPTTSGAANTAPTISGAAIAVATAGQAYSFTPVANDVDGDSLQFIISSKPAWASFDAATGRLSGVPKNTDVGAHEEIEISVTDGKQTARLAQFAITVAAAAPSIQNLTVSWDAPTTNSDGSTLTNLNGYRILYGVKSGVYTQAVSVSGAGLTRYILEGLQTGTQYYLVMIAVNSAGMESEKSHEVVVDMT